MNTITIKNGAGTGLDLESRIVDTTPQIISGVIKNKKDSDFSVTWAIINNGYSFINMITHNEMFSEIIPDPGEEIYIGNYQYNSRLREDWIGAGMGHKIGKYFGVGISSFLAFRTQDLTRSYNANILEYIEDIDVTSTLAGSSFKEDFAFRNIGMLWKIGINYEKEDLRLGLNITTPKLNLGIALGSLRRDLITSLPPVSNISPIQSTNQEAVTTVLSTSPVKMMSFFTTLISPVVTFP